MLEEKLIIESVIPQLSVQNWQQAYAEIAGHAMNVTGLDGRKLLDRMLREERLAPSAVGNSTAIPNMRVAGINHPFILFATLDRRVDLGSPDGKDVDMIFLLLSPETDGPFHLRRLARLSRLVRNQQFRQEIRAAGSAEKMYELLDQRLNHVQDTSTRRAAKYGMGFLGKLSEQSLAQAGSVAQ